MSKRHYIAVAGNMGSGKSSLVRFLCQHFDAQPFFEPNDRNPYLDDFYADMKRWAFNSQIYFLIHKFKIHKELEGVRSSVVQDRTIYEDAEIFAAYLHRKRCIDARDWEAYQQLYETLADELQPPDLMTFLRCPMRSLRKRIRLRGRENEREIPYAYVKRLNELYEGWFESYDRSPTLELNTEDLDYVTSLFDHHEVLKTFEKYLGPRVR